MTCCSINEFRGYQEKFGEYVESDKKRQKNSRRVMNVNFDKPVIYQLFIESQGIIHMVNSV